MKDYNSVISLFSHFWQEKYYHIFFDSRILKTVKDELTGIYFMYWWDIPDYESTTSSVGDVIEIKWNT